MKWRMKRILALFGAFLLLIGFGGFLFAWIGLAPISASAGHWPITTWFLHFAMRQSVQLRSMGTTVPALDDFSLVLRGAGHYDDGCAPCHGAPGKLPSPVAQEMTPHPPYLPPKIPSWESEELFWIVRHGVKFTGMPAWPAPERVDEVWAMVAFLRRLPEMTPGTYAELAGIDGEGEAAASDEGAASLWALTDPLGPVLENCARCHGRDGLGRGTGAFPKLADQSAEYLFASLQAYAAGERHSGIMKPVASGLTEDQMESLASYFAAIEGSRSLRGTEAVDVEAVGDVASGEQIALQGVRSQGIPPCVDCHGPKATPRNPYYPILEGQYAAYLALQLRLFKTGRRGGTPFAHIMGSVAARLDDHQVRDVAAYYASLPAGRRAFTEQDALQKLIPPEH